MSQETPTEIIVANASDEVNGDTSSVESLQSNPGADGTSLREAITATNNDPGTYSIKFATELAGATIGVNFDASAGGPLALTGGAVSIDGDIDGDGGNDVTIANAAPAETCGAEPDHGFVVSSSGNRLHAFSVRGVKTAVVFQWQPGEIHRTYSDNEVSDLVVEACQGGIAFVPPSLDLEQCESAPCVTDIRWLDTRILGNTIETGSVGINIAPTGIDGDLVQNVTISNNTIDVVSTKENAFGINVETGSIPTMEGNRIADVVIADNTVTGNPDAGIRVDAGGHASLVERVLISGNRVNIGPPVRTGSFIVMRSGIFLAAGDTEAQNGVYSTGNTIKDVEIADNILGRGQGVRLQNGCCGAARNVIRDIGIRRNHIETSGPDWAGLGGIWLEGGHGWFKGDGTATEPRTTRRNRMHDISIVANEVRIESDRIKAGIWLTGGAGKATRNRITCVRLRRNRVRGTSQPVLVRNNVNGASGNVASPSCPSR